MFLAYKALTTLIVAGKVVQQGTIFEAPATLGNDLISRGFAEPVKEATAISEKSPKETPISEELEEPKDNPEVEQMRSEYKKMKVNELRDLATANGIDTKSLSRKDDLVDALIQFELGE